MKDVDCFDVDMEKSGPLLLLLDEYSLLTEDFSDIFVSLEFKEEDLFEAADLFEAVDFLDDDDFFEDADWRDAEVPADRMDTPAVGGSSMSFFSAAVFSSMAPSALSSEPPLKDDCLAPDFDLEDDAEWLDF